jgi:hypothetical protein
MAFISFYGASGIEAKKKETAIVNEGSASASS